MGDDNFNASRAMVRWFDATATIADGRVVITPVEADSLYCLNLADGTLAWDPLLQRDELYVANIYRGKIILVGLHGVLRHPFGRRHSGMGGARRRFSRWRRAQWPWLRQR